MMNEIYKVGDKVISTKTECHGEVVATTVIAETNEPHSVLVRFNYDKFDCPGRSARSVSTEYSYRTVHEYLKLA